MLRSCTFRTGNLGILVSCVGLMSANNMHWFSFLGDFHHAGFWKFEESLHCLSRTWVCGYNWKLLKSLKHLYIRWIRHEHSTSLEGGRMSDRLAHLEDKKLLVVIQNTLFPCTRVVGIEAILKLELEALRFQVDRSNRAIAHQIVQSVHIKFN